MTVFSTTRRLVGLVLLGLMFVLPAHATQVKLETNKGDIIIALDADAAPITVENFLTYVRSGFYKDTIFHRVIPNFMIQGGGFTKDYAQKPTRDPILNEADNDLSNARGTIAMARTSDPNSATAQFFINTVDNGFLDHTMPTPRGWGYAVFGKVIMGMEVVDAISAIPTGAGGPFPQDVPATQVIIKKATVLTDDES